VHSEQVAYFNLVVLNCRFDELDGCGQPGFQIPDKVTERRSGTILVKEDLARTDVNLPHTPNCG
jgi:hypothetical protein